MIKKIEKLFKDYYGHNPEYYVNTGGRLELIGNHTDHNHGTCIVANCSLRIHAAIKPLPKTIKIMSEGYKFFEFDINDLKEREDDPTPCALCRGILFKLKELGFKIGGFEAYISSDIPKGSGVSSSAAFESLFGYIISYLYNNGKIDKLTIAKAGQFAENHYFHKPCGLLDQIGTTYGSVNFLDFKNIDNPFIKPINFDLPLDIYLIKSEGHHAGLNDLYARIPAAMNKVANLLEKKQYLADIEDFVNVGRKIDALKVDQATKDMARHFYNEIVNVTIAEFGLKQNDTSIFLTAVRLSQDSSHKLLKNTYVEGEYKGSPQEIIDNLNKVLDNESRAVRIHGGGFKGTVIAFVTKDKSEEFRKYLDKKYKDQYYPVTISKDAFVCKKY